MVEWIQANEAASWWMAGLSLLTFVTTLFMAPWVIVQIPVDYFSHRKRPKSASFSPYPSFVRIGWRILKNGIGALFVLAGIAMLVLPGQGVLMILLGLALIDFPGKFRMERWLITRGRTLHYVNRLRSRRGQAPLVLDAE